MRDKPTFNDYLGTVGKLIIGLLEEQRQRYGIENCEITRGIDLIGPDRATGDDVNNQPESFSLKFLSPKSGEDEIVQITVSPAHDWSPVLSISSTRVEPFIVETSGNPDLDVETLRVKVAECFRSLLT